VRFIIKGINLIKVKLEGVKKLASLDPPSNFGLINLITLMPKEDGGK